MPDDLLGGIDGLLAETQRQHDARRTAAMTEYRQLVRRADKPLKGDPEKLLTLLDTIGRTVDQCRSDIAAWQAYQRHQKTVVSDADLAKLAQAHADALDAWEKYKAEAEKETERLDVLSAEADRNRYIASSNNEAARRGIEAIEKQHPHLFDAVPAA